MTKLAPKLVLSLDFELRWGRHDRLGLDRDAYRENLEAERAAVPAMIDMLTERGLRATWATVGAVACRDWREYFARAPRPPRYQNAAHAVDRRYVELDPKGELHFAPELVDRIAHSTGQELGTHTFSHLPLREPGVGRDDVAADLAAVTALWSERYDGPPRSLVFPRNQSAFLETVRQGGIRVWRGNPRPWFFDRNEEATRRIAIRALKLLSDANPVARHAAPLEGDMTRASLFLRLDLPELAWRLHLARIRHELDGLGAGEIFHLWWHPHNVGRGERGLRRVREVLDLAAARCERRGIVSCTMGELVQ